MRAKYKNQNAFGVGGAAPLSTGVYIEVAIVCSETRFSWSSGATGLLSRAAMRERRALSPAPARTVPRVVTELERERLTVDTDDFRDCERDLECWSEKGLC